ncbi:MAG: histidine-type phosphatase [Prevotella sp.]|nr:histidine-type phosphatase [Prevotella sp.]
MKRIFFFISALLMAGNILAQSAKEEIGNNIRLTASNYLAYRGPQKELTKVPKGLKPFYISHYGRHGSRYLIGDNDYNIPLNTLSKAEKDGKLTPLGQETLEKVRTLVFRAQRRHGELTPLGHQQHRDIARRMYERFPDVFAGNVHVDAKSTVVIRCILSMENELQQLMLLNPQLQISQDASEYDMPYMNHGDKVLNAQKDVTRVQMEYLAYFRKNFDYKPLIERLFTDVSYVENNFDVYEFVSRLFKLASNIQSTESRHDTSLYNAFTNDELYRLWQVANAWWYLHYGPAPQNGGTQPFSQRYLLKNIIEKADSAIALPKPGATLRFGHETMVMPLTCLLGLNGHDRQIADIGQLEQQGWVNYRIFPMAANIQFVFYRKDSNDKDVLVKVLLNEDEATLPIASDMAPLYHWKDVREYYLKKIADYEKTR